MTVNLLTKNVKEDNTDNSITYKSQEVGFLCSRSGTSLVPTTTNTIENTIETAQAIVKATITHTDDRFNSLHRVIKSAAVLNPQNWPDADTLERYGMSEIEQLYSAFETPLQAPNVEVSAFQVQWTELKTHIKKKNK